MLDIHDSCLVPSACPRRLVQILALTLIQTQNQTRTPLLPGHHPDPRVHVQGLALARLTVKGDVGGVFRRWTAAIVDVEGRNVEGVTRVKIYPMTTGGDDSHHTVRGSQVDIR